MGLDAHDRTHLAIGFLAVVLIGGLFWLATALVANARLEECLQQRRHGCESISR